MEEDSGLTKATWPTKWPQEERHLLLFVFKDNGKCNGCPKSKSRKLEVRYRCIGLSGDMCQLGILQTSQAHGSGFLDVCCEGVCSRAWPQQERAAIDY